MTTTGLRSSAPKLWRWPSPIGTGHGALFAECNAVDAQTGSLRTREEERLHWK